MIIDTDRGCVVDSNSGEYLHVGDSHWQDPYVHCTILSAEGQPRLGANVERRAIDETGNRGAATLVQYIVREAWFPSGKPEKPTLFREPHPMIERLGEFLAARHRLRRPLTPDPRFEFFDERGAAEGEDE